MNIAKMEAKMEVQGPARLLEEEALALARAFSADCVLIVLQEVYHARVRNPSLIGNVDLRKALRGGFKSLIDFGADDIATHPGTPLRAGRGGGTRHGDTQTFAGFKNNLVEGGQFGFQRGFSGDKLSEVVVVQQFQLILVLFGLTFDLFSNVHDGYVFNLTEPDHPELKNQHWTMRCIQKVTIGKNKARVNV